MLGSGDISGNGGFDDGTCNRGEYGNNVGARGIGNDGNAMVDGNVHELDAGDDGNILSAGN